ncbi:hypothetical protein GCM10010922_20870 [Microbacterium sorbitolivorans]|uniref:GyrI-like small molecule binding domain-containing protein n=1 Tax=Microbacterium sorbitolivorans TaxID=1867410 RepID=A0A367Y8B8_9MICO|nr:GyrI-like domain-containing protein [Microbacterium sorbitolivorans]RCK61869.1 hypothetical protein DTO57_04445 [Microbacterium sorbitolivorans]GGF44999.1 hypothetical protein GCM10010922_20870 [Microbacterium sorbitolivorans]
MKIDLKKSDDAYRARRGEFRILAVPEARYLAVDGSGDPNTAPAYRAALEALYPLAYALKFVARDALGRDHVVPPLEGLWWADDMDAFTSRRDKSSWRWTMMIAVPSWIPGEIVDAARERAGDRSPAVELRSLTEGTCVQTLHVGPFDDEGPVIEAMHSHALADGYRLAGTHHEIYLSDPRRTAPERLRTILRQPVALA